MEEIAKPNPPMNVDTLSFDRPKFSPDTQAAHLEYMWNEVLEAGIPISGDITKARKVTFYIVTMYSIVRARPTDDARFAHCFPDTLDPAIPKVVNGPDTSQSIDPSDISILDP